MKDFSNAVPGNVKNAAKAAGAGSSDLWKVPPAQLCIAPEFNLRYKTDAYFARVRAIADSIKTNGYYPDKPIKAYVVVEDGEPVFYVVAGHTRHDAILLALSEGLDLPTVPVVTCPKGTTEIDLYVDMIVGNTGAELTLIEQARNLAKLSSLGLDAKTIASRIGYASPQSVDRLLLLNSAPENLRQMVIRGELSATSLIDQLTNNGDKAAEVILAAKASLPEGQNKIRPRMIEDVSPERAFERALKKSAPAMFEIVETVKLDTSYRLLNEETRKAIEELIANLKK